MTVDDVANSPSKPRSWVYGNWMGATAEAVKALPGIVVTVERAGKSGRPATVFTLRGDTSGASVPQSASTGSDRNEDTSRHAEAQPASAEREQNRARVVRLDAYRPAPKQVAKPVQEPKQSEPSGDTNPFLALLRP